MYLPDGWMVLCVTGRPDVALQLDTTGGHWNHYTGYSNVLVPARRNRSWTVRLCRDCIGLLVGLELNLDVFVSVHRF